ncbi:WXG100 family type VII secretion target [Streptomyces sp. CRN 30]|uniref:WXG100 family type VII secretion target n=1 Tax=Streptomyces sp. CRN 30 TaxID=3075613 RepID=UPI002A823135|nr:WXG100 family type VII secretion target [Streptomyces sp. CRN 30]
MSQFDVEPSELRSAADKIRDAAGRSDNIKLDELGKSADDFGHGDAAEEFGRLMATWTEAIKSPMKEDADNSADKLDANAASYELAERQNQNKLSGPAVVGPGIN